MFRKIAIFIGSAAVAASPGAAVAESGSYQLSVRVGVHCTVQHQLTGYGQPSGAGVSLGEIRELCNAQHGYELVVNYTPGSLRGTTIRAGDDEVVLNGSGQAVLSRVGGPRIRERALIATPGQSGFDAQSIQFSVLVA